MLNSYPPANIGYQAPYPQQPGSAPYPQQPGSSPYPQQPYPQTGYPPQVGMMPPSYNEEV